MTKTIVIVGGGTAGWLCAAIFAAKCDATRAPAFQVKVIEPVDIPIIGVGEGTWPTMRSTLNIIGVRERDFLKACHASFKQGSKFVNWQRGAGEFYYHPFEQALRVDGVPASALWHHHQSDQSYSNFAHYQEGLCENRLAPKTLTSPQYSGICNYGYHFDAGAMSKFLRAHCVRKLDVEIIGDQMLAALGNEAGDITAIKTKNSGDIAGDFFVDCTGFRSLLLKQHFGVGKVCLADTLIADRAMVAQLPYGEGEEIQSTTLGTAQNAGWVWDVSLGHRRGIGYVHSSAHVSLDEAERTLRHDYLGDNGAKRSAINLRELKFSAGYLKKFWVRNCVAIGLASGFVEPLEASSIIMTEISAHELARLLHTPAHTMSTLAQGYNERCSERWLQIADFLKLHYVLSERDEEFWRDNRSASAISSSLQEKLAHLNAFGSLADQVKETDLFPAESYHYVYFGMKAGKSGIKHSDTQTAMASSLHDKVRYEYQRLARLLPRNAQYLAALD